MKLTETGLVQDYNSDRCRKALLATALEVKPIPPQCRDFRF
jgi:hypothetical protein